MTRRFWVGIAAVTVLTGALALTLGLASSTRSGAAGGGPLLAKADPEAYAVGKNEGRTPDATAEAEAYAARAYPAAEVPLEATLGAQAAWREIQARGGGAGQWELIGPSKATYPGVLNALGDGDQYVAAGRTTGMAIGPTCKPNDCKLYIGAAGGGVWRTDKALAGNAGWEYLSQSFLTNAIGVIVVDPRDADGSTLYVGTGEENASGDSGAGMGIYKSTDYGSTWTRLPGSSLFEGRSIGGIALGPGGTIYATLARGVRGVSSVTGGATSNNPPLTPLGLYKSSDDGASFTRVWDGGGSLRGPTDVELDPSNPAVVYASAFDAGVWRSLDAGATWVRIKAPLVVGTTVDRAEFSVTKLANGKTRMYVGIGNVQAPPARFFRTDDAAGAAVFTDLTTPLVEDYCTGQCWYDNLVYSPPGFPDVVYVGGSYDYANLHGRNNGRALLLSTDAGVTFTDMTQDGDPNQAEALHPDHHSLATKPDDPFTVFNGSDGGVARLDGGFEDVSGKCDSRGLNAADLAQCRALLSRVFDSITFLNDGLSTLQFQSFSASKQRPKNLLQGGTQDNGTFVYTGSSNVWWQEIYGDGGNSGFNAADDSLRINTFFGQAHDVNFRNGDPTRWVVASGPIVSSPEGSYFYPPVHADPNPAAAMSIFQGSQSVWRTQRWGGDQAYLEANCPEFTTSAANPACGDFVRIGGANSDLTSAAWGPRAGGFVAQIERAPSNTGTMWVATGTGRVFITQNANDPDPAAVTYTRLDTLAANDPQRFVTSISVDPANPNRAWISYSGYNFNTPAQPGHVFLVEYNGATATWTNLDGGTGPMGDLPVTDLVRDDMTGTLYASTDFGVMKLSGGAWTAAGSGLPRVEVAHLLIVPSERILYAATHGRSGWRLGI